MTQAVLLNDGVAEAAVLPAMGAGLAWYDLVDGGARAPLFRPCRTFAKAHPFDLANILLVPWSNRISGGGFSFAGVFHALAANVEGEAFPLHGNGFSGEWRVEETSRRHVAMTLASDGPGPFRYRARAAYQLDGGALSMRLSATNTGNKALPFGLGLHPWIVRAPGATLQANMKEVVLEDSRHLPAETRRVGERADWDFRAARALPSGFINNAFLGWEGRASVVWHDRGLALDISADPALSTAIIYSPGAQADFFCFEPVTHPVDAHNRPGGPQANGLAIFGARRNARRRLLLLAAPPMSEPSPSGGRFSGVFPMLYAFFDETGALDRAAFARQVEAVIGGGAHGVAVLGLITEVSALTPAERQTIVDWTVEATEGRRPVLVTVAGADLKEALALAKGAQTAGADGIVIQPPLGAKPDEAALNAFFAAVMDAVSLPAGIQNAPEFLGVGLSPTAVKALAQRCPNFRLMKGEGPVVTVKPFVDALKGGVAVFNGRGGLELPDNLRAGCAGIVPAPDCADLQVEIYDAWRRGDEARADVLYAAILPYVVFAMQSIPVAVAYGKRMFAGRAGIDSSCACRIVRDPPDPFFLSAMRRWSGAFGPYRVAQSNARQGAAR